MKNYAFIFAGQGSQKCGMGLDFYNNFTKSKELLEEASDKIKLDFYKLLFTQNDEINISEYTQPAILLNAMMIYNEISVKPKYALGHSLGEISAICAMGGMDFGEAIYLTNMRGKFMQECADSKNPAGMLVSLGLDDEKVESICAELQKEGLKVYAANYNCDGQIVLAGLKSDLEKSIDVLKSSGAKRAMLLNMSVASHCPLMASASEKFASLLDGKLKDMDTPIIANSTTKPYKKAQDAQNALKDQLIKPVLYKQSIKEIENDVDVFVEFGSNVLSGLNKKITTKPTVSITTLDEFDSFCKEYL